MANEKSSEARVENTTSEMAEFQKVAHEHRLITDKALSEFQGRNADDNAKADALSEAVQKEINMLGFHLDVQKLWIGNEPRKAEFQARLKHLTTIERDITGTLAIRRLSNNDFRRLHQLHPLVQALKVFGVERIQSQTERSSIANNIVQYIVAVNFQSQSDTDRLRIIDCLVLIHNLDAAVYRSAQEKVGNSLQVLVEKKLQDWHEVPPNTKTLEAFNKEIQSRYDMIRYVHLFPKLEVKVFQSFSDLEQEMHATKFDYSSYIQGKLDRKISGQSHVVFAQETLLLANENLKLDGKVLYFEYRMPGPQNPERWNILGLDDRSGNCIIFSQADSSKRVILSSQNVLNSLEKNRFDEIVTLAQKNALMAKSKRDTLRNVDLPANKKVIYLRVFPKTFDGVVATSLQSSMIKGFALHQRYPQCEVAPILFTDDPETDIENMIGQMPHNEDACIILDFYQHGSPSEIKFEKPYTAKHLVRTVEKHKNISIIQMGISCYGGGVENGLLEEFKTHPEVAQRIWSFIQTENSTRNVALSMHRKNETGRDTPISDTSPAAQEAFSTFQDLHMILSLLKTKKTLGEMWDELDTSTNEQMHLNPRAVINGNLIAVFPQWTEAKHNYTEKKDGIAA